MRPPPWLPTDPDPAGRAGLVGQVLQQLRPGTAGWLAGAGGAGSTTVLGAVAARWPEPTLAVRVAGCRSADDILLAIGLTVEALIPGEERLVAEALRERGVGLLLLDDADVPGLRTAWRRLSERNPHLALLCTGRTPALDPAETLAWSVEPSPQRRSLPDPESLLPMMASLQPLAQLPAGLLPQVSVPQHLLLPARPGRQVLRRSVAEQVNALAETLGQGRVAIGVHSLYDALLPIAMDAPLRADVGWEDALALRWLGEVLADPDDAAEATAAAARLYATWGQPGPARALLASAQRRDAGASRRTRAVLSWVERDVLMGLGDERAAEAAHDHIRKLLREERDQALLALVERRFSERMVSWGRRRSAAQASREARTLYRQMDDKAGQAVTTRGSADLAVLAGEQHGAETLYEQVMTVPSSPVERMNRQLGFAGLQMLRGEYTAASGLLEHITGPDLTYPVVQANLALRRAELALRLGRHAEAEAQALEARRHYGRVGERVALGRVQRLRGDIAALAGRPAQAAAHYQEAMHWQLRMQDLVGFDRSLAHLAELERSAGDPQRAAALDQRRASIRELLQREEG